MRYVKVKLSFGDKLRLLFFGIIEESKLPEVVRIIEKEKEVYISPPQFYQQPTEVRQPDKINNKEPEDTLNIPFFDLGNDDDIKSNF